jgi:hypothetical protein
MRFDAEKTARLARERGLSIGRLLAEAGVSRNAFYHLARKPELAPVSVQKLARTLDVGLSELIAPEAPPAEREARRWSLVDSIARMYPGVDRDNVRHTLVLLDEKPESRLRRALQRGRRVDLR